MANSAQLSLLLVVAVAASLAASAATSPKLPSFIKRCSLDQPQEQLNECAMKNGMEALPRVIKGIAALGIPKLDPLNIPELHVAQGDKGTPSHLEMISRNVEVIGLGNANLLKVKVALPSKYYGLEVSVPRVEILADYEVTGQVIVLPIRGKGRSNITLENVVMDFRQNLNFFLRDGHYHAQNKDYEVKFNCSRAYFHFSNLFDGDATLGDGVNTYLNENWRLVLTELGDPFVDATAQVISSISKNFNEVLPLDQAFEGFAAIEKVIKTYVQ